MVDENSNVADFNIKFCPECGAKVEKPTIRCMHCGKLFVNVNSVSNEEIIHTTNKNINIETKHIEEKGLSFDYPEYYRLAKIPDNNPDCVVALAKDDGLCDIMVDVSNDSKMQYQEGIFENKYKDYIKTLGFYDFTVIKGWGPNETCVQAYSNTDIGVVKSTIYFDFNHAKDIRVTLNTLVQYDYDCMDDLKVIAKKIQYLDSNVQHFDKSKETTAKENNAVPIIIGVVSFILALTISAVFLIVTIIVIIYLLTKK